MYIRSCHGRDHMVVGFTTTYAISKSHNSSCEFEYSSWQDVLDTTSCDKVCQQLAAGRWFSPGTNVLRFPPPIKIKIDCTPPQYN